jgi:alkylhydroperoxidase family enzyme
MGYLRMIDASEATGALREAYDAMRSRPLPPVYRPPHGGAPGIHRAHSLDAALVGVVFGTTGSVHAGEGLSWSERELVAAAASRTNQCLY